MKPITKVRTRFHLIGETLKFWSGSAGGTIRGVGDDSPQTVREPELPYARTLKLDESAAWVGASPDERETVRLWEDDKKTVRRVVSVPVPASATPVKVAAVASKRGEWLDGLLRWTATALAAAVVTGVAALVVCIVALMIEALVAG